MPKPRLERTASKDDAEPPRDYAPKSDPQEKVTLAEVCGLAEKQQKA